MCTALKWKDGKEMGREDGEREEREGVGGENDVRGGGRRTG